VAYQGSAVHVLFLLCIYPSEAAAPPHEVLGEGHLCVEAKVEAMAPASAAKDPAAAFASEPRGAGVGVVVVARHCYRGRIGYLRDVN
jgi:hypothetical protein